VPVADLQFFSFFEFGERMNELRGQKLGVVVAEPRGE